MPIDFKKGDPVTIPVDDRRVQGTVFVIQGNYAKVEVWQARRRKLKTVRLDKLARVGQTEKGE